MLPSTQSSATRPPIVSLDDEYLSGVTLADATLGKPPSVADVAPAAVLDTAAAAPSAAGADGQVFCRVSNIWLENDAALRQHYKTDWYLYNLKRSTRNLPAVTEAAFEDLVENDAIGEELSADEDDEEGEEGADSDVARSDSRVTLRDADGSIFLAWRAALVPAGVTAAEIPATSLPQCLRAFAAMQPRPVWVVVLCRGGHFAAAAFELQPLPKGSKRPEDALKVLAHKCFHRYVTRRKAGGRQSVADASKTIKSAGSSIRRHNEAMLAKEIRELLQSWASTHLRLAHLMWVAAPGPANAAVLYSGADAPLSKSDGRLRAIPFNTARPTLSETSRAAARLSRVEYLDDTEMAALVPAPTATEEERAAERAAAAAALEAAAVTEAARQRAALEAATAAAAERRAAEEAAAALPSELHDASAAGDASLVAQLLAAGHDPTAGHIRHGFRVPYDVAKGKEVRNAFRRFRADDEARWDWAEAHVPEGLTEEVEAEREERGKAKAREKKKKAEKARKERRKAEDGARVEALVSLRTATEAEDVDALQAALQAALALYNGEGNGAALQEEAAEATAAAHARIASLTDPEWQKRRERERRAEAAEKRLGKLTVAQEKFLKGEH